MGEEDRIGTKPRTGIVNLERRKHPRFSVNLPIEYYRIAPDGSFTGRARNASEGGLLVYFPEAIEVGEYLKMKVYFSSEERLNVMEILTQVTWTDFHVGNNWGDYRSGVKFIDISPEDLERFRSFLQNLSE